MRHPAFMFALALVAIAIGRGDSEPPSAKHDAIPISIHNPKDLKWIDAPASLPRGAKIAVLEGDPAKEGPFVFRAKVPDGYRVPPHTHLKVERITVISANFNIGMGDKFNQPKTQPMSAAPY